MTITQQSAKHLLVSPDSLRGGVKEQIEGLPAFWKWQGRAALVRINRANVQYLHNTFPEAEKVGGAKEVFGGFLEQIQAEDAARELLDSPVDVLPDDGDYVYKRPPMDHQKRGFLISREQPAFAYFMEQGTGKTKVTLDNAVYLFRRGLIDAVLIVAWPNGVHRNWIDNEIEEDVGVEYIEAFWSPENTKKKRRDLDRLYVKGGERKLRIFAMNVEAFTSERAKDEIIRFLKTFRCLYAIDQSASIKNPSAKRTKFLIEETSKLAPYRRILDGDPVAEGASELYSQFRFLDPNIIGHDTWTGFKSEFCRTRPNPHGRGDFIVGYKNYDELMKRVEPYVYRCRADDCLDLPERVYKTHRFDLSTGEQRIFDEMKSKSLAFFKDGLEDLPPSEVPDGASLEASLAIVKNIRLGQIASGWFSTAKSGEKPKVKAIENVPTRLKALLDILAENPKRKALIFSLHKPDLLLIAETLGDSAVSYYGGIDGDTRAEAKRRFQNDDDVRYFVGQPVNAGIGHTLTAAHLVIFYSNHPSLRLRAECEKRAHRMGLKAENLLIYDLVARRTRDDKTREMLRAKRDVSNAILRDPEKAFLD